MQFETPRGVPADNLRRGRKYCLKIRHSGKVVEASFVGFFAYRGRPLELNMKETTTTRSYPLNKLSEINPAV